MIQGECVMDTNSKEVLLEKLSYAEECIFDIDIALDKANNIDTIRDCIYKWRKKNAAMILNNT